MGSYLSKPDTEKVSEGGEFIKNSRTIIYGATAVQGWRSSMEDAHSIVPHFDEGSSLFGVYDGHGGREVAVYCATHLADIIKSCYCGDIGQAMKDAFMKCDRLVIEEEAVKEMKTYDHDEMSVDENDVESKEELDNLLEESSMPLQTLLERYKAPGKPDDESPCNRLKEAGLISILQLLNRSSDIESSDDDQDESEPDHSEDDSGEELVTSTSQENVHDPVAEESETHSETQPNSNQVDRTDLGNQRVSSTESDLVLMQEDEKEMDSSKDSTAITSRKNIPDHMLKSPNKFNLMDLLMARPVDECVSSSSPTLSRKRHHPDCGYDDDTNDDNPKKFNPRGLDKQGYRSGTTAVVGILRENDLIVANAGDSKCVLASKGKAVDMSVDHKPTDSAELNRIMNAGGHVGADERINGGLNLSRAIGDHCYKENFSLSLEDQMISAMPDIKSVSIMDDEFIVFACDGICLEPGLARLGNFVDVLLQNIPDGHIHSHDFGHTYFSHPLANGIGPCRNSLTSQEVVDFVCDRLKDRVKDGRPTPDVLTQICESLCDACLAADTDNDGVGCDNMTCIIIFLAQT